MVYGGESAATGDVLDDLWVLDLTNKDTVSEGFAGVAWTDDGTALARLCPWHPIDASGSVIHPDGGVMDGGMVWVPDNREFILVGGVAQTGSTLWTTDTIAALDLDDLGDGLAGMVEIGVIDYATASWEAVAAAPDYGAIYCDGTWSVECWEYDYDTGGAPFCASLVWSESVPKCDLTYTITEQCVGSGLDTGDTLTLPVEGCATDPMCVYGGFDNKAAGGAPGLAGAGVTYDPVSDDLRVLGGFSGCLDGSCTEWANVYRDGMADKDTKLHAILSEWNGRIDSLSGAVTARDSQFSSTYSSATSWPWQASQGVSGVATAPMGLRFNHATRRSERVGNATTAYVGGSIWRDIAIIQTHDLTMTSASSGMKDCPSWNEIPAPGTWSITRAAADMNDGLISADVAIGTVSSGSPEVWTPLSLAAVPDARRDAAVTAIDDARILVVGGQGGGGASDVLLVDTSSGAVNLLDTGPNRYGATATTDPIAGKSYIIGGADSTDVKVVDVDDDPVVLNDGSTWTMSLVDATLDQDPADFDHWWVGESFVLNHTCTDADGGTRCASDTVALFLPTTQSAELETLDVTVTFDDGLAATPRIVNYVIASSVTMVQLRLPRAVADGEAITVDVDYDGFARDVGMISKLGSRADLGLTWISFGDTATASDGYAFLGLPAWMGGGIDVDADINTPIEASWTVTPADASIAMGTGRLEDPTGVAPFSIYGGPAVAPTSHSVMVLSNMDALGSFITGGGVSVDVFVDQGIAATPRATLDAYVAGTASSGSLLDDIDGLQDRLGSHPLGYDTVALIRDTPGSELGGASLDGYRWVAATSSDGATWNDGSDGDNEDAVWATVTHELSHAWLGAAHDFPDGKIWMQEGLAEFSSATLHPNTWLTRLDTRKAATHIVEEIAGDDSLGLLTESDFKTRYLSSSYIVLQAWLLHRAAGGSDSDFWAALRSTWAGDAYGDPLDDAALVGLLDGWAGFSGFHDQFAVDRSLSLAMPALTTLDLPDVGDTGSSGAPGELTITQVQGSMFTGVTDWDRAVYVLACSDVDDDETRALDQCQLAHPASTPTDLTPGLLLGSSDSDVPTWVSTTLPSDRLRWTMYAGADLLSYGDAVRLRIPASRASLLRCATGATSPACLTDTDGDGHPDDGDCDPTDADTHPLWVSPDEAPCGSSSTDHNCDGWTCPAL